MDVHILGPILVERLSSLEVIVYRVYVYRGKCSTFRLLATYRVLQNLYNKNMLKLL